MDQPSPIQRLLREPLLHFAIIGAVLFVFYSLTAQPDSNSAGSTIVITRPQVDALVASFTKTWQRQPAPEEVEILIQNAVREEVYYREAVAMGLDKDDPVIRRRLQQKLEFITSDLVVDSEATDVQLNDYLQKHPDLFRAETLFTFMQIYLNPEKHTGTLETDAQAILKQLSNQEKTIDPITLGDATLLEHSFVAVSDREIEKIFGEAFLTHIKTITPGSWQGPIKSSYGVHLVLVSERIEGEEPELSKVRDAVHREYTNAKRLEANEKLYQEMLKNYQITIEE